MTPPPALLTPTWTRQARRILELLEKQHRRLALIVDSAIDPTSPPLEPPIDETPAEESRSPTATPSSPPSQTVSVSAAKRAPLASTEVQRTPKSVPSSRGLGSQIRESSPSLARDMASRRGIPPPGRSGTPSTAPKSTSRLSARQARPAATPAHVPPATVTASASHPPHTTTTEDENFTTFYNNLTTGTLSRLTSALAFTGLPLTSPSAGEPTHSISAAALSALSAPAPPSPMREARPAESFYLVPDSSSHDHTPEELALENATLKTTLADLARRLARFEAHAQDDSMAALLTASAMAASTTFAEPPLASAPASAALEALEARAAAAEAERAKWEALSQRQERMLRKYAAKWEEVKRSAREKERTRRGGGAAAAAGGGGDVGGVE